eukprot:403349179
MSKFEETNYKSQTQRLSLQQINHLEYLKSKSFQFQQGYLIIDDQIKDDIEIRKNLKQNKNRRSNSWTPSKVESQLIRLENGENKSQKGEVQVKNVKRISTKDVKIGSLLSVEEKEKPKTSDALLCKIEEVTDQDQTYINDISINIVDNTSQANTTMQKLNINLLESSYLDDSKIYTSTFDEKKFKKLREKFELIEKELKKAINRQIELSEKLKKGNFSEIKIEQSSITFGLSKCLVTNNCLEEAFKELGLQQAQAFFTGQIQIEQELDNCQSSDYLISDMKDITSNTKLIEWNQMLTFTLQSGLEQILSQLFIKSQAHGAIYFDKLTIELDNLLPKLMDQTMKKLTYQSEKGLMFEIYIKWKYDDTKQKLIESQIKVRKLRELKDKHTKILNDYEQLAIQHKSIKRESIPRLLLSNNFSSFHPKSNIESAENSARKKPLARKSHSRLGQRLDGSVGISQSRLSGYEDLVISGNNSPARLTIGQSIQNSPDGASKIFGLKQDGSNVLNEYGFQQISLINCQKGLLNNLEQIEEEKQLKLDHKLQRKFGPLQEKQVRALSKEQFIKNRSSISDQKDKSSQFLINLKTLKEQTKNQKTKYNGISSVSPILQNKKEENKRGPIKVYQAGLKQQREKLTLDKDLQIVQITQQTQESIGGYHSRSNNGSFIMGGAQEVIKVQRTKYSKQNLQFDVMSNNTSLLKDENSVNHDLNNSQITSILDRSQMTHIDHDTQLQSPHINHKKPSTQQFSANKVTVSKMIRSWGLIQASLSPSQQNLSPSQEARFIFPYNIIEKCQVIEQNIRKQNCDLTISSNNIEEALNIA